MSADFSRENLTVCCICLYECDPGTHVEELGQAVCRPCMDNALNPRYVASLQEASPWIQ
jgi:hypothetical protein